MFVAFGVQLVHSWVVPVRSQKSNAEHKWASQELYLYLRHHLIVHMDWMTGFPESPKGFKAILVFICALAGMVHLQAYKKTDTAKDTAEHFVKNV